MHLVYEDAGLKCGQCSQTKKKDKNRKRMLQERQQSGKAKRRHKRVKKRRASVNWVQGRKAGRGAGQKKKNEKNQIALWVIARNEK